MRADEFIIEETSNRDVLQYIKRIHPKGEFTIDHSVMNHAEWELTTVPLSSLHIDTDEVSPYDQINYIDYNHVADITVQDIKNKPIVVDNAGWIIDGNHRAVAARDMGMQSILAYVPVESDDETYDQHRARINRERRSVNELKIDNVRGLGAVPLNQEVDYMGLRVKMKPSTFLQLSLPLSINDDDKKTIAHLEKEINTKGFGAPFLEVDMDRQFPRIVGHDGRHRMIAVKDVEGDHPVEVHIFPRYMRSKDMTSEVVNKLNDLVVSQNGKYVPGPIFTLGV